MSPTESIKESLKRVGFRDDFVTRLTIGRFLNPTEESKRRIITNKVLELQSHFGIQINGEEITKAIDSTNTKSMRECLDTLCLRAFIAKATNEPFRFII